MESFEKSAVRFRSWFVDAVLARWIDAGYDHIRGGFYEALDFGGNPDATAPRRVRVQARQIYVMSRAAMLGWRADDAAALANKGFEYFLEKACPEKGARGCVHLLTPNGDVMDAKRDLYDQAFLLLACAWRWRSAQDPRALELADCTIAFLNGALSSPHGGWLEDEKANLPRRQNPHMHLFEAFMALYDATCEEQYLMLADKVYRLFTEKFFDSDKNILREYFTTELEPMSSERGKLIEPGHMAEWVWLLDLYGRRREIDTRDYQSHLLSKAVEIGKDPNSVFLVDSLPYDSQPASGARRLWPQTEYLKALCAAAVTGDDKASLSAAAVIDACFDTYFNQPVSGLWYDQFDANGTPCAKNAPASILYHLLDGVLAVENVRSSR